MKLSCHLLLISTIFSLSISAQEKNANIEPAWLTLTEKNYAIQYPVNWDLDQSGLAGAKFFLFTKLTSPQDQFKENINLIIQNLKGMNIDLDKYVEISTNQVATLITNGKILESNRFNKDDLQYHKMIYIGEQGIFKLKFLQYFLIQNEEAYLLTLTCEVDQYDQYRSIGEKILDSFILK